MKIKDILNQKKTLLSFEIFPPKKQANFENVVNTAKELSCLTPDFMSITYGAGGTTQVNTVEIAQKINSFGLPSLAHLTCVGNTKESALNVIKQMKNLGIENVLALRGDIPEGIDCAFSDELKHASDLVKILKAEGFCVGGACYPECHPDSANRIDDIENLKYKIDAGVDFLTTQMFFDNNMLYSYLYRLESRGFHLPVFAGIMPITSSAQVSKMIKLSSAYVPEKLLSICDRFADNNEAMKQAGIAYATEQIIDLISNGIRGIHIYSMNKSDVTTQIVKNIDKILKAVNE